MLIGDSEAGHIDQIMCESSNFEVGDQSLSFINYDIKDVHTGTEIL